VRVAPFVTDIGVWTGVCNRVGSGCGQNSLSRPLKGGVIQVIQAVTSVYSDLNQCTQIENLYLPSTSFLVMLSNTRCVSDIHLGEKFNIIIPRQPPTSRNNDNPPLIYKYRCEKSGRGVGGVRGYQVGSER